VTGGGGGRGRGRFTLADYVDGVTAGDRAMIGRAITLVESTTPDHEALAQELLVALHPLTGNARRIGLTGVPGVGKSTFIEALGLDLLTAGHRLAVLAVDPTSGVTGGSILGDKTRMVELSRREEAFIRPSPSSGALGGVARSTREAMQILEAAGFDVVIVETVGVGQSETEVAKMVDLFVLLLQPGAGDELQGLKRGILELADLVAVNKADGDLELAAKRTRQEFETALHLMRGGESPPPVVMVSAKTKVGLPEFWSTVDALFDDAATAGQLDARRRRQLLDWMWTTVERAVVREVHDHPAVRAIRPELEREVVDGVTTPVVAARRILDAARG
jgi:LAO/AO transport system kinase